MRRLLAATFAGLLLLGACGGDDEGDQAATVNTSEATTSSTAAGEAGAPTETSAAGSGPGVSVTAARTSGGAGVTTKPGGTTSGGSSSAAGPYKPAQPGTYSYRTTGKASSPAFGEQPIDRSDKLTVEAARGEDQKATQASDQGSTEQVFRFSSNGVHLVSMRTSQQGVTKEFKPASPVVVLPYPVKPGQEWSWKMTSTDGKTNVDAKFTMARTETVDVGGEKVDTIVLDAVISTSGDITSTSKQNIWTSTAHRLQVQVKDVTDGNFGGVQFHSETTRKLQSTKPA